MATIYEKVRVLRVLEQVQQYRLLVDTGICGNFEEAIKCYSEHEKMTDMFQGYMLQKCVQDDIIEHNYPIRVKPDDGFYVCNFDLYWAATRDGSMWNPDKEYGKARIKFLNELIQLVEEDIKCSMQE